MIDLGDVKRSTFSSAHLRDGTLRYAENMKTDPDAGERLKEGKCVVCYYREGMLAGQAFTNWTCAGCDKSQPEWPNTAHPEICTACSQKYGLCVECCADIDLKERKVLERK